VSGWKTRAGLFLTLAAAALAASWTDRREYDLVLKIRAEASPRKRVALLDEWKEKYPKTELRQVRNELYLAAYESMGNTSEALRVAREVLADHPDNLVGLYWCTLLAPETREPPPELFTAADQAARRLLAGLDGYFSAENKPASMADDRWQKQKHEVELLAHRALAWIQWQRGDYAAAEDELTRCLRQDPKDAEISAWFGIVLTLEKQPEKQSAAFWHMARAASVRDEGALPDTQQREMNATLERLYAAYHGDGEGLDQLRALAAEGVFPPAGFKIESKAEIDARRAEEELRRTNPELAAWLQIRKRLEAPDGEAYFAASLHNTALPRLKGSLIRFSPDKKPDELVLGMSDPAAEEVILKLSAPMPNVAETGTQLSFEGTADSFSRSPFSLTVTIDPEKIGGWPAPPPAAKRKKGR